MLGNPVIDSAFHLSRAPCRRNEKPGCGADAQPFAIGDVSVKKLGPEMIEDPDDGYPGQGSPQQLHQLAQVQVAHGSVLGSWSGRRKETPGTLRTGDCGTGTAQPLIMARRPRVLNAEGLLVGNALVHPLIEHL